jgi:hypothetical protein
MTFIMDKKFIYAVECEKLITIFFPIWLMYSIIKSIAKLVIYKNGEKRICLLHFSILVLYGDR